MKWRAKQGLGRNISSFITSLSSHGRDEDNPIISESGNQQFYQLPSEYPNIPLAMPVMGLFNQSGVKKQSHRPISTCTLRMGKGTEEHNPATEESMLLETSLSGKRHHLGKNAPGLPQFPFSFFWIKQIKKNHYTSGHLHESWDPVSKGLSCTNFLCVKS